MQKIIINGGFLCPNRDGSKGRGGCTFCNNNSFSPNLAKHVPSISAQIEDGIRFFARKAKHDQGYLAYLQSYSNTYKPINELEELYTEILNDDRISGLIIGTRPDCASDEVLDLISRLSKSKYIMVEYGVESVYDRILASINRCHNFSDSQDAIRRTKEHGLHCAAHIILGLPGETRQESIASAEVISSLPIDMLKIHQLQIIKDTKLADEYEKNPEDFQIFKLDEYIDHLVKFISHIRRDIILDRFVSQCPPEYLLAPKWNVKNFEFVEKLKKRMAELGVRQGDNC